MNSGIINSLTRLHLVGCFYWIKILYAGIISPGGKDSSVGIVARYGLDGSGFESP
jgi:hypothetical protein